MPYKRRDGVGLAVLLVGQLMTALDVSIVNVAVPSIATRLSAGGATLVLVSAGYTLSYATLLVTGARVGDDHGHRRIFLLGLGIFTAASLACGLAPSGEFLVVARIVQGGGGALIAPQVLSVIQRRFAGSARRHALGWYAMTISLGAVTGQLLGGLLTSADILGLSWRAVFLVNVPVGLILLTVAPVLVPPTRATMPRPIDRRGTALIAATVAALLVPLALGRAQGWPLWVWPVLVVGLALAAGTVVHLLVTPTGRAVVDLAILRQRGVAAGFGSLFATMAAYGGLLFCLALLLQDGLGFTPLESGLALVPYILGFATVSLLVARVSGRALRIGVLGGLAVVAVGYAVTGILVSGGMWPVLAASACLFAAGAGVGFGFGPVLAAVLARIPTDNAADASGALNTTAQFGYLTGVAVFGSWFLGTAHLPGTLPAAHAFEHVGFTLAAVALLATVLAVFPTQPRSSPAQAATVAAGPGEV